MSMPHRLLLAITSLFTENLNVRHTMYTNSERVEKFPGQVCADRQVCSVLQDRRQQSGVFEQFRLCYVVSCIHRYVGQSQIGWGVRISTSEDRIQICRQAVLRAAEAKKYGKVVGQRAITSFDFTAAAGRQASSRNRFHSVHRRRCVAGRQRWVKCADDGAVSGSPPRRSRVFSVRFCHLNFRWGVSGRVTVTTESGVNTCA